MNSRYIVSVASILMIAVAGVAMPQSRFNDTPSEPVFMAVPHDDLERLASDAQATLGYFRTLIAGTSSLPIVKSRFENAAGDVALLWLSVESVQADGFEAIAFEAPSEFSALTRGSTFIPNDAVKDWAVSIDGIMHGGFSLRLQRSKLPEVERQSYDDYVGAPRGWAPLPQGAKSEEIQLP